jgi:hypothetical protein
MPKAGQTLKLAAPGYVKNHPEHLRKGLTETLSNIFAAAEAFNAEFDATVADKNLSSHGRAAGLTKVAASALAKLNTVETTTIKNLTDRATSIEQALLGKAAYVPPKDPTERIAHEMRMRELRDQLRELPPSERLSVYLSTSDPLILAAIETAPMTLSEKRPNGTRRLEPFIDPEQRTAAVLARAEREDPETVKTLREVQSLRQVYSIAVNSVRREILHEVPGAAGTPALTIRT